MHHIIKIGGRILTAILVHVRFEDCAIVTANMLSLQQYKNKISKIMATKIF